MLSFIYRCGMGKKSVRKVTQRVVERRMGRCSSIASSSSKINSSSNVKFGGNAILLDGTWASRSKREQDETGMGRWATVIMEGKHGRKLAIITAYRVVQNNVDNAGVKTSVAQQYAMLREMGKKNPNPRQQMLTDLKKYIRSLQDKMEIVLVMDANEQWEGKSSKIKEFAMDLGLRNVGKELHDYRIMWTMLE